MRLPFQSLFERRDFVPMDSALARLWGGANIQTSAGVGVSEDSALNIAAYWRGVQLLSGQIAALPLHLYKGGKSGAQTRFTNSKLYKLLHDAPNPEMTAFSFREAMQAHLLTWGNAFAEIERNNIGQPINLWLITPDRVIFFRDLDDKQLKYRIAPSGRIINAVDMLHIPGLGFDGLIGYSVIGRARQSLGLTVAAERYGATFFGNGASFGGVLESPDDMDDQQRKELRKEITDFHQGPDRAHRFLILWNGLKYSKMAMAPEDAQFLQTRTHQVVEIARWIGVPPNKLYESSGRMPASSIEALGIEYYTDTMLMWGEKWEQELNRKLVPALEQNYQYFEFDFAGLMRADTQARFTAYNMAKQGGWLSADDIRALENMGPLPNGAGDFYLAPLNMIPADKFREYIGKKIDAKTTIPAPPSAENAPAAPTPTAGSGKAAKDPQEAVDEALRRADAAELAAAEARGLAQARADELARMREQAVVPAESYADAHRALDAAQGTAQRLTDHAEKLRREAKRAKRALKDEQQARAAQAQRADVAEAALAEMQTALAAAEAQRDQAAEASSFAEQRVAEAQAQLEQANAALAATRAELQAEASETARLAALHAEQTCAVDAARAELDAATATTRGVTDTVAALQAQVAEMEGRQAATAADLASAQIRTDDLQRQILAEQARVAEHADKLLEADVQRARVEEQVMATMRDLEQARQEVATAVARAADAERARDEARDGAAQAVSEALAARQAAEAAQAETARALESAQQQLAAATTSSRTVDTLDHARLGRSLTNRRARLVHTMRRMITVECERLQRAAGSPEKLRRWAETFYGNHEELCVRELQLTVEDHVINSGRADDPDVLTRVLVRQHVEESKREIAALLASTDPDALPGAVFGLCQRWERDRVETLANTLLQDELDQIRARLANLPVEPAIPIRKRVVNKIVLRDDQGRIVGVREEEEPEA